MSSPFVGGYVWASEEGETLPNLDMPSEEGEMLGADCVKL